MGRSTRGREAPLPRITEEQAARGRLIDEDEHDALEWMRSDSESGRFDQRYVTMLLCLRWAIVAAYIALGLSGLMVVHPLALAGSAGWIAFTNCVSTWHWAQHRPIAWYDSAYLYLDFVSVMASTLATANLDYPIWMAFVMLMIQAPAEQTPLRSAIFNGVCVLGYMACAGVLAVAGWFTVDVGVAAVTVSILGFIGFNLATTFGGNRRIRGLMRTLATTDPLTGLANRRQLSRFLANPARDGRRLALIVMDVDRFKQYNDTYGHLAGDQLLVRLAEILRGFFLDAPMIARYGGDEFVVAFHCTSPASAATHVDEMLNRRSRDRVPVSVGIAIWPDHHPTLDAAFAAADDALRAAKRSRRGTYATADAAGAIRLADVP